MSRARRLVLTMAAVVVLNAAIGTIGSAQAPDSQPNPFDTIENYFKLPDGGKLGSTAGIHIDHDGMSLWAFHRCGANSCVGSTVPPVLKFDASGTLVKSFGAGMFIRPHGIYVDRDGNIWVTDAVAVQRTPRGDDRGHQVVKFSPTGEVLLILGDPGTPGAGPDHFTSPSDVVVAPNGDIFVADGHNEDGNNRIVKFTRGGKFVKAWGKTGYAPGEFRTLHAIALDSRGRLFVADRFNNRIQIFDQEGKFLAQWTQFGRPSGIFFDTRDQIYVADSESDDVQNPGWEMGIRIGDARSGWVTMFIQYPWGDPRDTAGNGAEFVAVDRDGNLYGGEPRPKKLQKYVRVRP